MSFIVGITMGDATGIGPEIVIKALNNKEIYELYKPLIVGDAKILKRELQNMNYPLKINEIQDPEEGKYKYGYIDCINLNILPENLPYGKISPEAGNAAYRFIEKAVDLAIAKKVDAICTAPINKLALQKAGWLFPGHTEILAKLTKTENYSMMLVSDKFNVIHITTHVGLMEAIELINPEKTYKTIKLAYEAFKRAGQKNVKIAVCGINPHAGENELFGNREEETKLIPGISKAQSEGINVTGPYPADTLFYRAARGDFDVVVACYHDQGHIPIKVMGIEGGVNITVGLKNNIIRTSVDHGTAFDIAGKYIADERSLIQAIHSASEYVPKSI